MTDSADDFTTCKEKLNTLLSLSKDIVRCTQGDVLGFSRLADLQSDQVQQVRKIEFLMKEMGDCSFADPSIRALIDAIEKVQSKIDYNLKVHAQLMSEELSQLKSASLKLHSLKDTYKIKFKRFDNNVDTKS